MRVFEKEHFVLADLAAADAQRYAIHYVQFTEAAAMATNGRIAVRMAVQDMDYSEDERKETLPRKSPSTFTFHLPRCVARELAGGIQHAAVIGSSQKPVLRVVDKHGFVRCYKDTLIGVYPKIQPIIESWQRAGGVGAWCDVKDLERALATLKRLRVERICVNVCGWQSDSALLLEGRDDCLREVTVVCIGKSKRNRDDSSEMDVARQAKEYLEQLGYTVTAPQALVAAPKSASTMAPETAKAT